MNWNRTVFCWLMTTVVVNSLSGCATIVKGGKNQVTVDNSGGSTYFSVLDSHNRVIDSGMTPKQVTLKTKREWLKPAKYHVVYASQDGIDQYDLNAGFNWWTAGNIVIGGVPGIAIDAATGALWKLQPKVIGNVPAQSIVANESQGAALVASHSESDSAITNSASRNYQAPQIRQASFGGADSANQPTQSGTFGP